MTILLAALVLTFAPFTTTRSVPHATIEMRSPLSGSVLVDEAIRDGRIRLPFGTFRMAPNVLKCSPTPCVVPNVQASSGSQPVDETPIALNPNNGRQLLTGGNDYNCGSFEGFFASSNRGTSWHDTCMQTLPGTSGDGDPNVAYDLNNKAYIAAIDASGSTSEIAFETSTNNGLSWSAPALAVTGIPPYGFVDKPWTQIDDSPTSSRANAIYISSTQFDSSSNTAMVVSHSTNGGDSWTEVMADAVAFPLIDQFTDLATGSDGTVYLSWMRCSATGPTGDCGGTKATMFFSKSSDGGNTWTVPVSVAKVNLVPDTCGQFYGCLPNTSERVADVPAIDVDRSVRSSNGRLYVVMYNWTGNQLQVEVSHSRDGGATWSRPVVVSPGAPNDEFFPWVTTSPTGAVGITWLDRRLDPSNINYDSFSSFSTNGGLAFTAAVRLSSVSSDPFNDGFGGSFMGDYSGNIWSGVTLLASWTDTRSGVVSADEVGGYHR